jgi:hypothetical protein
VWRTPAAAAAGSFAPASWWLGLANKRAWMVSWCKRKIGATQLGGASGRSTEFTAAAPMADDGGSVLARGEEAAAFIAGRKAVRDVSLRVKVTKSWYGPRHGRSTARGGAAMCGAYAGATTRALDVKS